MIVAGALFFVVGVGVWCGVRFSRTTTGIVAALAVCTFIWGIPLGLRYMVTFGENVIGWFACASPFMQLFVVGLGTGGSLALRRGDPLLFVGPAGDMGTTEILVVVLFAMGTHVLLGAQFADRAGQRLRRIRS
jgi:hypothetical protein